MPPIQQKFKKKNTIAYDADLRKQLKHIHDLLGEDVTDVASQAMEYGFKFQPEAKSLLKAISKLTSDLSITILDAKSDKKKLNKEEQEDFDRVKGMTDVLGNLQYKMNEVIKDVGVFNKATEELYESGLDLAEEIVTSQEQFRELRSDFNAIGFLSKDPNISSLLDE